MSKHSWQLLFKSIDDQFLPQLRKLSTENLIIWIVGKSEELGIRVSLEDATIVCWKISPAKHSLRGYTEYPDSFVVVKRFWDMKGRKGLLEGAGDIGFKLTIIGRQRYHDIQALVTNSNVEERTTSHAKDRSLKAFDEAPYRKLKSTPAYQKLVSGKENEIVETDFLYFYGVNWHTKSTVVEKRLKNTDLVVKQFSELDNDLDRVHRLLNEKFSLVKERLLKRI